MVESFIYLGCVQYVRPVTGNEYRFAKVDPLVRSSPDRTRWGDPVYRPGDEFPARGQVFWNEPPVGLEEGTYWHFQVEQQPTFDGQDRSEKYQVDNPKRVIEVIDLQGRGDEATLRRLVTQEGIRTDPLPLSSRVLLHISPDRWIGPVDIVKLRVAGTWKIAPNENLSLINRLRLSEGAVNRVNLKGSRCVVAPSHDLGEHTGYVNWVSDVDLASGLLKRLRKVDRAAFEALNTTYAVFDGYIAAMQRAGLLGRDLEQELGRLERVREIRETVGRNDEILKAAVGSLLKSDTVRDELRDRKERFYHRLRRREQRRVEGDFSKVRAEIAEVDALITEGKREIQERGVQLEELEGELKAKEDELDRAVERYEQELTARLRELAESPEKAFAELAILRGLLSADRRSAERNLGPNWGAPSNTLPLEESVPELSESTEVLAAVAGGLNEIGFSPFLGLYLHIAFLAGSIPILAGPRAFDILEVYSSVVAGGRTLWIPVSASAFEPQDLLGRFDPTTQRIVPHPGGLLAELTRAESGVLSVVALDGFNRAPVGSYLLPLLDAHTDVRAKQRRRRIPLFPPGLVDASDPYSGASHVGWPSRVLLSMIPVTGAAMLPVPPEVWRHAVLIDTDRFRTKRTSLVERGDCLDYSTVRTQQWTEWQSRRGDISVEPIEGLVQEMEQNLPSAARNARDLIPRLYAAARASDVGHSDSVRLVLEILIIPSLHKEASGLERLLETNGVEIKDVDGIIALATSITD